MLEHLPDSNSMQPLHDLLDSLTQDQQLILFLIELACGEIIDRTINDIFTAGANILAGNEKYDDTYLHSQYAVLQQKDIIHLVGEHIKIS